MITNFISMYLPSYPKVLVYMLQSTEYQIGPYIKWLSRTKDFTKVMQRRSLEPTKAALMLLFTVRIGIILYLLGCLSLAYFGPKYDVPGAIPFAAALVLAYPLIWAYLLVVPLLLGRMFISQPAERQQIIVSKLIFAKHPGKKIAVAGSYAKTTMKEMLNTVLAEGLKVAATPANKNVSISHAKFAQKLDGDEDVLIIEYGEGAPGDVARFADLTHPTHAVITGLAPAHLDQYKTLRAAGEDIFSVADYLKGQNVYVNGDSPSTKAFIKKTYEVFNSQKALGWSVSNVKIELSGTDLTMSKGKQSLKLHSQLLGHHHVGFIAFVAALAIDLGLSEEQVITGIAKTKPFEHRMQPYRLDGAWIVDDTYNGNLEGIRAGTRLLNELEAKRKVYVTPGLVDQGEENEPVHLEVGKLIARAQPDLVVLMQNSVTDFINQGLRAENYKGELRIESNPLEFYTNLKHFVAGGDLVVMQNDWTDNYA